MPIDAASPRPARGLVIAVVLLAMLWIADLEVARVAPPPVDIPATGFSAERAVAVLRGLLAESVPHPMGSAANAVVRERIVERLRALGYAPQVQADALVCGRYAVCGNPSNIVVRVDAASTPAPRASASASAGSLLLAAHYDSVPAGPGASDDGTGVVTLLEIARLLKTRPPLQHAIVLLFADGEELGMLGARAFVQHHPWARDVKAAVNVDNRGTTGPSLMFETGSANAWLMQLFGRAVGRPISNSVYYAVYKSLPNDTDFTEYKEAGAQGFNFAYIGGVAHYHTPSDDLEHVDLGSVQQQGDNALAALLALDSVTLAHPPAGDAVYFDLFGRVLLRLPQALLLPVAITTLVFAVAGTVLLVRRREITVHALVGSIGGEGLAIVGGIALARALVFGLNAAAPLGLPDFIADPRFATGTFTALAAACVAVLGMAVPRRANFWSLWCAHLLWTCALGVACAALLTGASYLWVMPGAVGAAAVLLRVRGGLDRGAGREAATLALLLATFVLSLPVIAPLYGALGTVGLPLLTGMLVQGGAPLAGLLLEVSQGAKRLIAAGAVKLVMLGSLLIGVLPAYTVESPQPLNLKYLLERAPAGGPDRARWLVVSASPHLPAALGRLARFEIPEQLFNLATRKDQRVFTADAPLLAIAPPHLDVLSTSTAPERAGLRRLHYRLFAAAPLEGSTLQLGFPPAARVGEVAVSPPDGHTAPLLVPLRMREDGWTQLTLAGSTAQGVNLDVDAADTAVELHLLEAGSGLPAAGRDLAQARPPYSTAVQGGDVTLVAVTLKLPIRTPAAH